VIDRVEPMRDRVAGPRQVVVGADGRAKAYRPLPAEKRIAAVVAGLEAYAAGDFFEAHELMEPAWMGTADPAERGLIQGLIKVAAADVHRVRGNPAGVRRNLEGARDRLASGLGGSITGVEVDVAGLLASIDAMLGALDPAADRPLVIDWRRR
jgi:predicted metal-dependent hydrolase